jgi:hypothetical protein
MWWLDRGSNLMKTFESIILSASLDLLQFEQSLIDSLHMRIFDSTVHNPNLHQQIEVLATRDVQKYCHNLGTFRIALEPATRSEEAPVKDDFKMMMASAK